MMFPQSEGCRPLPKVPVFYETILNFVFSFWWPSVGNNRNIFWLSWMTVLYMITASNSDPHFVVFTVSLAAGSFRLLKKGHRLWEHRAIFPFLKVRKRARRSNVFMKQLWVAGVDSQPTGCPLKKALSPARLGFIHFSFPHFNFPQLFLHLS